MFESFVNESIGRRVNLLFRLSMMYLRTEMKTLGVGAGDYALLFILFWEDGLSQDELTQRLRVDKSQTARAVAKMEKMKMVRREPDPHEHRIKRVFLGKKSLELKREFFTILKKWQLTLVDGIPEKDVDIIRAGMDRMMLNAEKHLGLEPFDMTKK